MKNPKKRSLPFKYDIHLSKEQSPKTPEQKERTSRIPYASAVGSLMYAMLYTRPDICYAVRVVSRYQSDPGEEHWITVKHILKYLRKTRDHMLVYSSGSLETIGFTDSNFQGDVDSKNPPLDMCLPYLGEPFVGGVSNKHVLLTPPLKLNMWLLLKLLRKMYG